MNYQALNPGWGILLQGLCTPHKIKDMDVELVGLSAEASGPAAWVALGQSYAGLACDHAAILFHLKGILALMQPIDCLIRDI